MLQERVPGKRAGRSLKQEGSVRFLCARQRETGDLLPRKTPKKRKFLFIAFMHEGSKPFGGAIMFGWLTKKTQSPLLVKEKNNPLSREEILACAKEAYEAVKGSLDDEEKSYEALGFSEAMSVEQALRLLEIGADRRVFQRRKLVELEERAAMRVLPFSSFLLYCIFAGQIGTKVPTACVTAVDQCAFSRASPRVVAAFAPDLVQASDWYCKDDFEVRICSDQPDADGWYTYFLSWRTNDVYTDVYEYLPANTNEEDPCSPLCLKANIIDTASFPDTPQGCKAKSINTFRRVMISAWIDGIQSLAQARDASDRENGTAFLRKILMQPPYNENVVSQTWLGLREIFTQLVKAGGVTRFSAVSAFPSAFTIDLIRLVVQQLLTPMDFFRVHVFERDLENDSEEDREEEGGSQGEECVCRITAVREVCDAFPAKEGIRLFEFDFVVTHDGDGANGPKAAEAKEVLYAQKSEDFYEIDTRDCFRVPIWRSQHSQQDRL